MSTEPNGAGSVTTPEAPVATPPNPAPAATTADAQALAAKLELISQDNKRKGEINARKDAELAELKKQLEEDRKQRLAEKAQRLEANGDHEKLYNDLKVVHQEALAKIEDLEAQLQQVKQDSFIKDLEQKALGEIVKANACDPSDVLSLLRPNLREVDGRPVVLNQGLEQPLTEYLEALKTPSSSKAYLFKAAGRGGMGANVPMPPGMEAAENPWATGNVTQQMLMLRDNPELANAMIAQASAAG